MAAKKGKKESDKQISANKQAMANNNNTETTTTTKCSANTSRFDLCISTVVHTYICIYYMYIHTRVSQKLA